MKPFSGPRGAARFEGLDGLRGVAMLMVIACHLQLINIGWTGLQSFYVLSGFLITRVLLKDHECASGFGDYLKRFYIRRFLRVFPIYYAYLLVLTVAMMFAPGLRAVREQLPYAYLYVYNFCHLRAHYAPTRTLDHLWSLSVEEQFYLIWPFVIALVPRRAIQPLLLALAACGPLWRALVAMLWPPDIGVQLTANSPLVIYLMTTSHLDGFAMGALLNFVDYRPRAWHLLTTLVVGLGIGMAINGPGIVPPSAGAPYLALGWPLFLVNDSQSLWGYTVVNFFWLQVIAAILHVPRMRSFFSLRALDFLGKRSYATYIVHYPILGLFAPLWRSLMSTFGRVPGTLALLPFFLPVVFGTASLSYRLIEMPMLRLKDRFGSNPRSRTGQATAARPGGAIPSERAP